MTLTPPQHRVAGLPATDRAAALSGVAIAVAYLAFFHLLAVKRTDEAGKLVTDHFPVVDGTAYAPFQYRPLIPQVTVWLTREFPMFQLTHWVTIISGASFLAACVVLTAITWHRYGTTSYVPLVVLYLCFWGVGAYQVFSPETLPSIAVVAVVAYGLRRKTVVDHVLLAVGAFLLLFMRTEMVAMLGAALLVRWWLSREVRDAAWGIILGAAGAAVYVGIRMVYSDAIYTPGAPMNQIDYNLSTWKTILPLVMAVPVLVPLVSRFRRQRDTFWNDDVTIAVWAGLFTATAFFVARPAEVRMWLPFVGLLAIVAAPRWVEILGGQPVGPATPRPLDRTARQGSSTRR